MSGRWRLIRGGGGGCGGIGALGLLQGGDFERGAVEHEWRNKLAVLPVRRRFGERVVGGGRGAGGEEDFVACGAWSWGYGAKFFLRGSTCSGVVGARKSGRGDIAGAAGVADLCW